MAAHHSVDFSEYLDAHETADIYEDCTESFKEYQPEEAPMLFDNSAEYTTQQNHRDPALEPLYPGASDAFEWQEVRRETLHAGRRTTGNNAGKGLRFPGYCEPCAQTTQEERDRVKVKEQPGLWKYKSERSVLAFKADRFTNETLRFQANNPHVDNHVKSLNPLVAAAPWFDIVRFINYPVAHLLCHGVIDGFLHLLFPGSPSDREWASRKPLFIATRFHREIENRIENLVISSETSRPPKRITSARGQWTYDDSAHYICEYMPLIGVQDFVPQPFLLEILFHLRQATLHLWFDCHPGLTFEESQIRAKNSLETVAFLFEKFGVLSQLTSNLHSAACHLVDSERSGGPVAVRKELKVETKLGCLGSAILHKVTSEPERQVARNNLVGDAIGEKEQLLRDNGIEPPGEWYPSNKSDIDFAEMNFPFMSSSSMLSPSSFSCIKTFLSNLGFPLQNIAVRRYKKAILAGPTIRTQAACNEVTKDCNVVLRDQKVYDLVHEHAADSKKGITDIPTEGADIKTIYFFLGTGYQVVRNGHICSPGDEHGDKVHEQLAEYVRSLSSGGSNLDIERDGLDVTRYQRYQCGYEVITSQVYARARSRISYNVSLEPCEADNFSHASVDAYYLVSNPTNGEVMCRLAMAMAYPTMENLDESVIDMSHCGVFALQEDEKRNIVLPISRIQTKVIFHRPLVTTVQFTPRTYGQA
ncbi:hypothetical protein CYMTET_2803 [Cymbomonas tetramitiformis]|uniref:Uncharacterized protein n=1 Tax=Cymbomonas tetramitiformis TaxID=36881 RepID=A0AAE0H4I5_9CHLO|nr:hypothetical protein CYMTET_2803 [Cymbomonas tetramitiformis]